MNEIFCCSPDVDDWVLEQRSDAKNEHCSCKFKQKKLTDAVVCNLRYNGWIV
jgi:hypothetical protein